MLEVFTNGCFDILHKGHIELLAYCKSLGRVTVGLNSDLSIKRIKGKKRPIILEQDRKRVLESLRYVDEVIIFEEDTPYELIRKLNPDLIVKGGDYIADQVVGSDLCEVRIFEFVNGYSTSRIISKLEL
jgi:D-beta-D-heptose 7-phosphate kinase/D-beta-D-heptose 1-phosphate adenosyltransferase